MGHECSFIKLFYLTWRWGAAPVCVVSTSRVTGWDVTAASLRLTTDQEEECHSGGARLEKCDSQLQPPLQSVSLLCLTYHSVLTRLVNYLQLIISSISILIYCQSLFTWFPDFSWSWLGLSSYKQPRLKAAVCFSGDIFGAAVKCWSRCHGEMGDAS